ncbi:MAG: hypothetical protein QM770_04430 [Tepidisphaeraceae bacterium]
MSFPRIGGGLALAVSALFASSASAAVIFSDTFTAGSTLNPSSYPTPTATSTGYDLLSTRASTSGPSIAANALTLTFGGNASSGASEIQARIPSSTLATAGDSITYTAVFTNTSNLLAAGTSSMIYAGLYDSAGSNPVVLNNAGLNTTTGSSFATGNAANWQGYSARVAMSGGSSQIYTRPLQNGAGTTSANQDVVGNNAGGGLYNNPTGTSLAGNLASTVTLATGGQYTYVLKLTRNVTGTLTYNASLYDGVGTGGTQLSTQTASTVTALTYTYDAIALGYRTSGTSLNPVMTINSIAIDANIQPVLPEPAAIGGIAAAGLLAMRRRR